MHMYLNNNVSNKSESDKIICESEKETNDDILEPNSYIIINELIVSKILCCPTKKHIISFIGFIQENNIKDSYDYLNNLINKYGISLFELITYTYEYCMDFIINNNNSVLKYSQSQVVNIIKNISSINENLTYCNNDSIHIISFLSIFYL